PPPPGPPHLPRDVAHVGAGGAGEAVAARPLLGHQHVAAGRAEQQHRGFRRPARPFRRRAGMAAEAEEELAHAEVLELFQAALARLVQDPLLCDLPPQVGPGPGLGGGGGGTGSDGPCPPQVTAEEIGSQVALEYGQAMTVRVCKADGETMPVVVVQNASVLELKKALRRHVQLRQARQGGVQHLSWKYIWRTYHLTYAGEKLADDRKKLREYGIRNRDEVSFIKKLRK
ncbi:SNR25 protein, partial [Syrrhaptes paradoxus]|nr:SNR25 protein [Syrrhaptes paradoxus]